MTISMIAALGENRVIGKDQQLPWHLPKDMRFFKQQTTGHPIIMGRKSFEALGKALPNRLNIVITRQNDYTAPKALVVDSLEKALAAAKNEAERKGLRKIFVTGGEQIYRLALPQAGELLLTEVAASPEGDTYFPDFDPKNWQREVMEEHPADEKHAHAFGFVRYVRK